MTPGAPKANGIALGEVTYRALTGQLEAKFAYVNSVDGTTLGYADLRALLTDPDVQKATKQFQEALETAAAKLLLVPKKEGGKPEAKPTGIREFLSNPR